MTGTQCEVGCNEITEEDLKVNEEISATIADEEHVKSAYNAWRKRRGLQAVDFSDSSQA